MASHLAVVVGAEELIGGGWVGRPRHQHAQHLSILAALLLQILDHLLATTIPIEQHLLSQASTLPLHTASYKQSLDFAQNLLMLPRLRVCVCSSPYGGVCAVQ